MNKKFIKEVERQLLKNKNKHIDSLNSNGHNVLHLAVQQYTSVEAIKYLLDRGADIKSTTSNGANVIHLAVESMKTSNHQSTIRLIKFFIEKKINVNASDALGDTPLHYAIRNSLNACHSITLVSMLLKSGARINASNKLGETALHVAVDLGNLTMSEFLVSAGANIDSKTRQLKSALQISVEKCNIPITKLLLEKKVQPVRNINNQESLLHIALKSTKPGKARMDLVEILLKGGVNVNAFDASLSSPLHLSLEMCDEQCSNLLINHGACVNSLNSKKQTPLLIAVQRELLDSLKLLLSKGANPNFVWTATSHRLSLFDNGSILHMAVFTGSVAAVRLLTHYGANTTCANENSDNLRLAITINNTALTEFFLRRGADVNDTIRGRAPLFCALGPTASVRESLVQSLLDYGADYKMENYRGDTALSMAWREGRHMTKNHLCLIRHLALLRTMNKDIGEVNIQMIREYPFYKDYFIACIMELTAMKSHKLTKSRLTPYDLLIKQDCKMLVHFRNENVVNFLQVDEVSKSYPKYSWNLRRKYAKAQERMRFMNSARRVFNAAVSFRIPPELVTLICKYLSNDDLANLHDIYLSSRKFTVESSTMNLRKGTKERNFYNENQFDYLYSNLD
ncbi:hypothetical protein QAD02_010992 [Eretmocerus hayati]|uniref:Uncharacterized protein n=1 Tax=Eretmocerus hayati TaxID=131215 RepID=A0ACC2NX79_9HYME|nr:hypothetical protein QAD02_010992 [Eretmocerus hayati]